MADIVTPAVRSQMMSRIRGRDTKAEIALRKALHARGYRYRVNDQRLQGSPDIVFPKFRAVVFVHGCFWHRHTDCVKAYTPKSRVAFWQAKFDANVQRDQRNIRDLQAAGWRVAVVWECTIGKSPSPCLIDRILGFLHSSEVFLELPQ